MDHVTGSIHTALSALDVVRTASIRHDEPKALRLLAATLRPGDLELVILFLTAEADAAEVAASAEEVFGDCPVIGCTTAGEITSAGYSEGEILAIGLPRRHFRARTLLIDDLVGYEGQKIIDEMIRSRNALLSEEPGWMHEFNFMMIDGLSTREDRLISDISVGLGPVPLFGGSAGDGVRFQKTFVLHQGRAHRNAAVLSQIRTNCPVRVFNTDHLTPTEQRMVVTCADPANRTVSEINAEPAAREYARILGRDPEQLTTFTFAAHPVVVRIGGRHHVRAIQRVADNGDLVFFSAIDEGLVLTLANPDNMVTHLEGLMEDLSRDGRPAAILACDCILRRMEAQQTQLTGALSSILRRNKVLGFSTYGEQINSMHVNQTLTGVAIYPPES